MSLKNFRTDRRLIMENMHLEPITKEILEMLAKYTFTPERNFGIYDNISISGDGEYIEFYG